MNTERDELAALRHALSAFGASHGHDLVAEARGAALERARSILTTEMTRSLLEGARASLESPRASTPSPAPPPARDRSAQGRPAPVPDAGTATYVYGIAAADAVGLAEGLAGVPGVDSASAPFTIEFGGLAAIASTVQLAEFGEERLKENLNDVEWLEGTARAHEHVLDAARAATTTVPLRLCTIYHDEDHVRAMLERERPILFDALERLDGKTEWGVKLVAEPGALEGALAAATDEEESEVSAGVAYLKSRSREARARDEIDDLAAAWAAEAHDRLAERADEALLNPLQNPEVGGYEGDMLLNGVYLVADDGFEGFREEVERLVASFEDREVTVELTGPWPPYNFVKGSIEAAR